MAAAVLIFSGLNYQTDGLRPILAIFDNCTTQPRLGLVISGNISLFDHGD